MFLPLLNVKTGQIQTKHRVKVKSDSTLPRCAVLLSIKAADATRAQGILCFSVHSWCYCSSACHHNLSSRPHVISSWASLLPGGHPGPVDAQQLQSRGDPQPLLGVDRLSAAHLGRGIPAAGARCILRL